MLIVQYEDRTIDKEPIVRSDNLLISELTNAGGPIEVVERKGKGHPDTICDALAEELSHQLCAWYLEKFGIVLHHNVDKVLLRGGASKAVFGGGDVLAPIDIYLAGRATTEVGNDHVPLEQLAVEGSRSWLKRNMHALDVDRDVRIHCLVRSGSEDLKDVFGRSGRITIPLSNDTSIGVGYAPVSQLESLILKVERHLTDHDRPGAPAAWGEDVKIMGVQSPGCTRLTVATAMISRFLKDAQDYEVGRDAISSSVARIAESIGAKNTVIDVNMADDPDAGSYYLTVTGTSAEAGDDGQVGRGNRVNGLITPYRPMTLEAAAGKNPVNHVGKLYNVTAQRLSERIVRECEMVQAAQCFLVSQIGKPITEPAFIDVRIATIDGSPAEALKSTIQELTIAEITQVPKLVEEFVNGLVTVY
jgi:S-adenosylmethionine synthetase